MEIKFQNFLCYPCHRTLPQLPQFSILMNLYFVYVINIRFICDGKIYLLYKTRVITLVAPFRITKSFNYTDSN